METAASAPRGRVAILIVSLACAIGCSASESSDASPRVTVRLAMYEPGPFSRAFADRYGRMSPLVRIQLEVGTPREERGTADLGLSMADAVYYEYRNAAQRSAPPSEQIRAIASLHVVPFHLLARSGIHDVEQLRGRSLAWVTGQTPQRVSFMAVALGMLLEDVHRDAWSPASRAAKLVADGRVDAAVVGGYLPSEPVRSALQQGARLLPLEGPNIRKLQAKYRFLRETTIPAGTYPDQRGPIHTIGVDTVLVCRRNLDESVVYELTRRLFNVLPSLSEEFDELREFDVQQAPVVPIPLHEGAARYYRELELLR